MIGSCVSAVMKFLSLKNGQTDGQIDMQVEIVNWGSVLCKLRKSCGQLEPEQLQIGQF